MQATRAAPTDTSCPAPSISRFCGKGSTAHKVIDGNLEENKTEAAEEEKQNKKKGESNRKKNNLCPEKIIFCIVSVKQVSDKYMQYCLKLPHRCAHYSH